MYSRRASTESLLVAAAVDGDRAAFAELCALHAGAVNAICRRLTRNQHDAEDLAQEAFARAQARFSTFDLTKPFLPWMKTLARNILLDHHRSLARRPVETELNEATPIGMSSEPALADRVIDRVVLIDAVRSMHPRYRRVIRRRSEGYSYQEIAAELGTTMSAMNKLVGRATLQLRERVGALSGLVAWGLLLRMRLRSAVIEARVRFEAFVGRLGEQGTAAVMGLAVLMIGAGAITMIVSSGPRAAADQGRRPMHLDRHTSQVNRDTPPPLGDRPPGAVGRHAFDAGPLTVGTGHRRPDDPDPTGGALRIDVRGPDGQTWFWYEDQRGCGEPRALTPQQLPVRVRC